MLIRAYGEFWNPDTVRWGGKGPGNKGNLSGWYTPGDGHSYLIDFWEAAGIYALHDQFKTVYIGKAIPGRMGPRLREHITDRFAGRWDMFSWFSLSTVNITTFDVRAPGTRKITADTVTATLEALAIIITDAPLNRKHEQIPDAIAVDQEKRPHPKAIRKYLEEILAKL